jgi:flavin-dependent dehydrogenase
MSSRYEVIIVGAGPAGASLAARLAKAGREVLLVDQSEFPRSKVCGECLAAGAWRQLVELGLGATLSRMAARPAAVSIVAPSGRRVELALRPASQESLLTISRYELDRMLVDRAVAYGAELLLAHRLRRVLTAADGVCGIEVSPSASAGSHIRFGCRMLFAADGRHSQIVRQTGVVRASGPKLVGFKTHIPVARWESPASAVEMHSFAGGYLGTCRVENGMVNVCGLLPPSALRASRGSVPLALEELLADPDGCASRTLQQADAWQTIACVQQQVAEPIVPGVLYVGDAQGSIEPLAGQGVAMALESAALAAGWLSSCRAIDRGVQQAYQAQWSNRYRSAVRRAARFGWLLRHPRVLEALVSVSPVPQAWKELAAHHGYRATRLRLSW